MRTLDQPSSHGYCHVTKTYKMADGEQLSDFLTSQNISIGLRSDTSGHDKTLSAKQKSNQPNNLIQRRQVTGSNISDNYKLDVTQLDELGGVCLEDDREDEGLKTIDCKAGVNHIPRLVFLGSDEDISQTFKNDSDVEKEISDINVERSESDRHGHSLISRSKGKRNSIDELETETQNGETEEDDLTRSGRYSRTSLYSTDSELLADHNLDDNSEDIERFIMENEMADDSLSKLMKWHCHDPKTFLLPDKMARNQLITVSILCFVFMVGEAIGRLLFAILLT